ncbi:MAG: HU family DNA-binding protein [Deltaproteobacteria bacterium]|nr:HU family DNA-binding protein [Deltaproteobacteria bacterium]
MNKSDLVQSVIDNVHLKKKKRERQQYLFPELNCDFLSRGKAVSLVNSLFEIMAGRLEKGEQVAVQGFGRFKVKFKWAGKGRNPRTGESIIVESKRIVQFKAAPSFRERLNK